MPQATNHRPYAHIDVSPSAVAELSYAILLLATGSWEKRGLRWAADLQNRRPDLVQRVRSLWDEQASTLFPGTEIFTMAALAGYIQATTVDAFLQDLPKLPGGILEQISRQAADDQGNETAVAMKARMSNWQAPGKLAEYQEVLAGVWEELEPIWEREGLPLVQLECTRLHQRLRSGVDILDLLPANHFARLESYVGQLTDAGASKRLVITPLYFAPGGHLMDGDDGTLYLGYGVSSEGVHRRTVERAARLATGMKALADTNRLIILTTLGELDVTVGDLARLLQITQPSVSGHLKLLQDAGLVTVRRKGAKSFYRVDTEAVQALLHDAMSLLK